MMRCREASTIISTSEPPRELGRRLRAGLHLLVCPDCRAFRRQIQAMGELARAEGARLEGELPADFEAALARRLGEGR